VVVLDEVVLFSVLMGYAFFASNIVVLTVLLGDLKGLLVGCGHSLDTPLLDVVCFFIHIFLESLLVLIVNKPH
jgi:hypothetical protein